jgi:uncharacterized protein YfaS (alpha-2-macroglobulin family)
MPANPIFYHASRLPGIIEIYLENGSKGLANVPLTISISGPKSFSQVQDTDSSGFSLFELTLNNSLPIGKYTMTVSAEYEGNSVSKQTTIQIY